MTRAVGSLWPVALAKAPWIAYRHEPRPLAQKGRARMLTVLVWIVVVLGLLVAALAAFAAWTAARVEKGVPPIGRFVEVEGTRLHYLDEGTGPAVVLVHGLGGQMQHLTYSLRERLRQNHRVIFLDRPGAGYSQRKPGASARLPAQGDMVAAFIAKLGLVRPLVVGHSLGGAVALATALDHPAQVGGLALIAPLTHLQPDPPDALKHLAIASPFKRWLFAWTLAVPAAILGGKAAMTQVFAPDPLPGDFATCGGGLLALRPKAFYSAASDLVAVRDDLDAMVARYPSLAMPIGILFGTADNILKIEVQGQPMLATAPGVTLETVEGRGHMLPISATDRTVAFIEAMMARVAAQAPAH